MTQPWLLLAREKYAACAGCHGEDGKGMPSAGFPNIVDDAWQYGGTEAAITETIVKGRKGGMPAQLDLLGENKVHVLLRTSGAWAVARNRRPLNLKLSQLKLLLQLLRSNLS